MKMRLFGRKGLVAVALVCVLTLTLALFGCTPADGDGTSANATGGYSVDITRYAPGTGEQIATDLVAMIKGMQRSLLVHPWY